MPGTTAETGTWRVTKSAPVRFPPLAGHLE